MQEYLLFEIQTLMPELEEFNYNVYLRVGVLMIANSIGKNASAILTMFIYETSECYYVFHVKLGKNKTLLIRTKYGRVENQNAEILHFDFPTLPYLPLY